MNKNQFVNKVANAYTATTYGAGDREKALAVFILKNFYSVESFFPNEEGNLDSGINLDSLESFNQMMKETLATIQG